MRVRKPSTLFAPYLKHESLMNDLHYETEQRHYYCIESKAAHLLYFVVKNHPFTDGNKRSAAFMFVDFLNRNSRLLNAPPLLHSRAFNTPFFVPDR